MEGRKLVKDEELLTRQILDPSAQEKQDSFYRFVIRGMKLESDDPLLALLREVAGDLKDEQRCKIEERGYCGRTLEEHAEVGPVLCLLPKGHEGGCALLYECANCEEATPWPPHWPVTREYMLRYNFCCESCKVQWEAGMKAELAKKLPGVEIEFSGPQDRN